MGALLSACTPNDQCVEFEALERVNKRHYYHRSPYTGCFESHDAKGQLTYKGSIEDGKLEGDFVEYSNGVIRVKGHYSNNFLAGTCREFYGNGKLKLVEHYDSWARPDGERIAYYENGFKKSTEWFKKGVKSGPEIIFYEQNGNLHFKRNYTEGQVEGYDYEYTPGGQLLNKRLYENGHLQGYQKVYLDTLRQTFFEGTYRDGELVGTWKFLFSEDSCLIMNYDTNASRACDCDEEKSDKMESE